MDELEIDGKKYLSSRRAAKEHKYHIDYIGQLIRAGKVVGKKVGRSWYVEQTSLNNYLNAEAAGSAGKPTQSVVEVVAEVEEVAVEPEPAPEPEVIEAPVVVEEVVVEEKIMQPVVAEVATPKPMPVVEAPSVIRKVYFSTPAKESSNLTYIEDTEPMLPVLNGRTNADFVSIPMRRVERQVEEATEEYYEEEPAPRTAKKQFAFRAPRIAVIATVAVIMLAVAAVGSSMLATSIQVTEGQPASVGITIK